MNTTDTQPTKERMERMFALRCMQAARRARVLQHRASAQVDL